MSLLSDDSHGMVKRYLPDSVYVWACGEKAEGQLEDTQTSDVIIGWLNLLVQGLSYITLIVRADEPAENASYSLAAVTGAMYLLVATATPDLQAGFSLLTHGASIRHHIFGAALLTVFGLLITASMKLLFTTAEDDATVLASSATVLFVADLDEKALTFYLTVPKKWRLFWATNMVGISFALALAGIVYVGNAAAVEDNRAGILATFPSWSIFAVNTAAVTWCSYFLSSAVRTFSDARAGDGSTGRVTFKDLFQQGTRAASAAINKEPWFYVTLLMWLGTGAHAWWFTIVDDGFAVGIAVLSSDSDTSTAVLSSDSDTSAEGFELVKLTKNLEALVVSIMALLSGLAMRVPWPQKCILATNYCSRFARVDGLLPTWDTGSSENSPVPSPSRVPSLLLGWGIGYWVTSLLYLLGCSWKDGGWEGAPVVVTIIGYIVVPLFFMAGVFLLAEKNALGSHVGHRIESFVPALQDKHGVLHWMMVTVLRDVILLWMYVLHKYAPFINIL